MLTAIKGTYDNGQIILHETPPVQERTEVIVMFLENETVPPPKPRKAGSLVAKGVQFGSLTGKISIPPDFNEPLGDLSEYM